MKITYFYYPFKGMIAAHAMEWNMIVNSLYKFKATKQLVTALIKYQTIIMSFSKSCAPYIITATSLFRSAGVLLTLHTAIIKT